MNALKEWYREKVRVGRDFFDDYGKVTTLFLMIVTALVFIISLTTLTAPPLLRISFLDVGQGDAILIQTPHGHDMLIDGGGSNRILEKLSSTMNYLDHHLDVVVATHPDADHITGLIPVLATYDVSHIIVSPLDGHTGVFDELQKSIDNEHASLHVGTKGDEISFGDGVVTHILYPASTYHGNKNDTNDASVSMVVTYGDESVLLTGDLPSTHEGELPGKTLPHNVTIYKAGHHGSKYSSGDQLLSYIKPEYAVISAGKDNKYGHPNPEAVERLQKYTKEILSTIDRGTITFFLDGSSVRLETSK